MNVAPFPASTNGISQLNESHLAFEANYAVEFRNQFKSLLITQAGEMAPHCEMTINAPLAQAMQQVTVTLDKELKD